VYDPGTQKVSHLGKDKNSKEILADDNFGQPTKQKTIFSGSVPGKEFCLK
jgi:hypothetical protein